MKKIIDSLFPFFVLSLFVIIVLIGAGCGTIPQPITPLALSIGEKGIINDNSDKNDISGVAILAVDENALDYLIQAQITDDKLGYSQMLGDGKLFLVDNGTAVKVIGIELYKREVRILEGKYLGESGWIAYEFVISK